MSIPTTEPTKAALVRLPRLPPELWLLIFRFATSVPIIPPSSEPAAHHYEPFRSPCHETTTALFDAALRDKCAITLVCRQWHALAWDMRYEDIRIGHGIAALHTALSEPATTIVNGIQGTDTVTAPSRLRVRRAVLHYANTATPTRHAPQALALLALLPHLEVLVRPPIILRHSSFFISPRFEFPTAAPTLPALRRLEWAFDQTGDAARAGGINSLNDILIAAPSLHELVLTSSMPFTALRQHRLHLRALRTLRLHAGAAKCPLLVRQTTYWVLPVLENIVVEGPARAEALEALWERFGGQVRVLELEVGGGEWEWGGMSMGDVNKIVGACPALEELNLRLDVEDLDSCWDSTTDSDDDITRISACSHNSLQRVGVCIDAMEWSVKTWIAVTEYLKKLGKEYPALPQVALHVHVQGLEVALQNPHFHALRETLSSSGRQLLLRPVHT